MAVGNAGARTDQKAFRRWLRTRPESDVERCELLAGQLVRTPPAGWVHGRLEAKLTHLLEDHTSRHQLGREALLPLTCGSGGTAALH